MIVSLAEILRRRLIISGGGSSGGSGGSGGHGGGGRSPAPHVGRWEDGGAAVALAPVHFQVLGQVVGA